MKLSDYIAGFLHSQEISHVFVITGGAALHVIDSIDRHPDIDFICLQHEQACAMAADGFARVGNNIGCALTTSGPGGTNLITGICSAYYDSIPILFLTGQVSTFRMKGDTGVRQIGFQETDIIPMCKSVTKYAKQVTDPTLIRYEMEKACYIARTGRPGPVLIDLPDNLQRADIDPSTLKSFVPPKSLADSGPTDDEINQCLSLLAQAKRPMIVLGWGVHAAGAERLARKFIEISGLPFVPTWAVADILPSDSSQYVGTFGTHGTRYANFAVQNADLILSIGSRLDTKATGSPITTFARGAKKIVVDIDGCELGKFGTFGMPLDLAVQCDARKFFEKLITTGTRTADISPWMEKITDWKKKYPVCQPGYSKEHSVNPYTLVKTLSRIVAPGDTLIVDTGCTLAWMMQAFEFKEQQRLFHDWNNTAMGWALPAAIGACLAKRKKRIICVTGDGSLQMNIQELATVIRHNLPIKVVNLNNNGYGMIQQTQDQWLDSHYVASSLGSGLAFPDFIKLAEVYGFDTVRIVTNNQLFDGFKRMLDTNGPSFCNIEISLQHRVMPQVKFGRPNEDLEPLLERKEFFENMIVAPLEVSL